VPTWVVVACATAIALGTYCGGWRIIKTLGTKVVEVRPPQGAAVAYAVVDADRSIAVAASLEGIRSARENGVYLAIAVARGLATPEQLRRAGAHTVVAELHELL